MAVRLSSVCPLTLFSSPEPKAPGELLGWVTVRRRRRRRRRRRPSVHNFFKLHLLLNHWMDSNQTWQKWSLGGPLSKLFKEFDSMQNSGCYGNKREKSTKTFKNLLVRNQKAQVFDIWYIASSSGPLRKFWKLLPWGPKWPCPRVHCFYIELYRENLKKSSALKPQGSGLWYLVWSFI